MLPGTCIVIYADVSKLRSNFIITLGEKRYVNRRFYLIENTVFLLTLRKKCKTTIKAPVTLYIYISISVNYDSELIQISHLFGVHRRHEVIITTLVVGSLPSSQQIAKLGDCFEHDL